MAQPKGKEIKAQTAAYGLAAQHFDLACQYKDAADLLYDQIHSDTNQKAIREPTYYLYHHAVELALKAFLCACNKPLVSRSEHHIDHLYKKCRKMGLVVRDDHHWEVHNCIDLLAGERNRFYRYPTQKWHPSSDLDWTRDVVTRLFDAVAQPAQTDTPRPSGVRAYIGKPTFFPMERPANTRPSMPVEFGSNLGPR
jgi:hypothetical protein